MCAAPEQAGHLVRSVESVSVVLSEGRIKRKAQRQIGVGDEVAPIGNEVGMAVLNCLDAVLPLVPACRHKCALQMGCQCQTGKCSPLPLRWVLSYAFCRAAKTMTISACIHAVMLLIYTDRLVYTTGRIPSSLHSSQGVFCL